MSANTTIEWATRSWNPVRGCSRVSSGCDSCYAMRFAHRFAGPGKPYEGLTTLRRGKVDWSGHARFIPGELAAPLGWRRSERVFVNSMSDLFHHSLSFEEVAAIFGVMAACPHHTFLVLTKRPERAIEFFAWLAESPVSNPPPVNAARGARWHAWHYLDALRVHDPEQPWIWPLPNVHLGVSVENQATANERIPLLYQCPAAVRWISAEPLLGPVNLLEVTLPIDSPKIDWVVVGGESGPGARPFHVEWARSLVRQCEDAGVSAFVKQLGANVRDRNDAGFDGEEGDAWDMGGDIDRIEHDPDNCGEEYQGAPVRVRLLNRKGNDPAEWPEDLRVRDFPRVSP